MTQKGYEEIQAAHEAQATMPIFPKGDAECSEEMRTRITRLAIAVRQCEVNPGNGHGSEVIEAVEDLLSAIADLEARLIYGLK